MIQIDTENERIVKEFIDGPTVFELVRDLDCGLDDGIFTEVRKMADLAKNAGLNIDYFPTNFVLKDGLLYYVDYECNPYSDEWNFENWGVKYWWKSPEFLEYLKNH
jgi:tRNA A-37 threonylcarbamoyl transferase component Bud32